MVLYCRVSGREQERIGTLERQVAFVRAKAADLGLVVVDVVVCTLSGWDEDRFEEARAMAEAHGASLLAHTADRFVRSDIFYETEQRAAPGWFEFAKMARLAGTARGLDVPPVNGGVRLVTLVDPDAPAAVVRAAQCARGQMTSGRKGGRPAVKRPGDTKRRRERSLPKVLELGRAEMSLRHREGDGGGGRNRAPVAPRVARGLAQRNRLA